MATKSDDQITQDVIDELFWDPAVTVADLSVSTTDQRVRLMGTTATYGEKMEAENAAYRVADVRYVENAIAVDPGAFGIHSDEDIAADVRSALTLDYQVPDDRITVSVFEGTVTLTGSVGWYYQSRAAADDAAMIKGVKFVENDLIVTQPEASATDISDGIARAFARHAELYDDKVVVLVDGGHVTLSGTVGTWGEYDTAEEVAWRSAGVTRVTNNILVLAE